MPPLRPTNKANAIKNHVPVANASSGATRYVVHLVQGRYKTISVDVDDPEYVCVVSDDSK
jgi:hypothetical protein